MPLLQLRGRSASGERTAWQTAPMMASVGSTRAPWLLLHNPSETARLSSCGLIDRLVAEIAAAPDDDDDNDDDDDDDDDGSLSDEWLRRSVTGRMVLRVAASEARALGLVGDVELRVVMARGAIVDEDVDDTGGLVLVAPLAGATDG
jgi:hypothetical protein